MTSQKKTYVTHILMIIGLVLPALIPVGSFVLAQEQLKHFSSPHSISTSDFGIESPAGMAYSAEADSFIVWSADNALHIITSQEEMGGKLNIAQSVENPLGVAFEDRSNSLFILSAGDTELAKIDMGKSGMTDASDSSNQSATRFDIRSFDLQDAQGLTFDAATGRLFILDARRLQVLIVSPHPAHGFDGVSAQANNSIRWLSVESLTQSRLRGIAFNPNNGHLYVGSPAERKVYELTEMGERVSTYDVSDLNLENPATMLFAPSRDATDDPTMMDLYILDSGQNSKQGSASRTDQSSNSQMGQIVELSLQVPAALPPGTTVLAATLVRTFATSNVAWNPSSPDPSGIDYWPSRQHFLIVDSEVDEMPNYYVGKNVFESTTSGALTNTCDTTSYSDEPSGLAINPTNNHLFISDDNGSFDSIYEVSLGPDGAYCTADDIVTVTNVNSLYNVRDAEDVAYGNNTLFIAGGDNAEVYIVPLGANGVLGGGDDGSMTHFDTAALGFNDLEGIGYNSNGSGTLFIVSTIGSEKYLGETTKSGTLLRAYDLSFMGSMGNLRSDVTYAPSSQNPAVKNIYIASRGVDNASNPNENDGKVWEVRISTPVSGSAHVEVNIGGALIGTYDIAPQDSERPSYVGVDSGPVKVQSTNNVPIVAALRDAWMDNGAITSSIQLMGLPENQLSDTYLFPAYNNVSLDDQLRFANVGTTPTTVTVTIGGIVRGSYNLNPSQGLRVNYAGLDSGPVVVKSSGGVKIIASIRDSWHDGTKWSSYAQLMGLPKGQLSDTYLFPAYNNVSLNDQLRFGNVGTVPTIVTVTIGGIVRGNYPLNPNQSTRVNYSGLDSGPVEVKSSGGVKIIASIRDSWHDGTKWTSYFQLMGLPKGQLSDTYLFPAYDNVSLDGQLRFGNVGTSPTTVTVTINGVVKGTYNLAVNQSVRVNYAGLNTGPVKVQSSGGVKIIASLRDAWFDGTKWTSYSQLMGLPGGQLSTAYLFPAYNNVSLDNQLRIGVP